MFHYYKIRGSLAMNRAIGLVLGLGIMGALAAQAPGKVLVIGIDGCRTDALRMADAPSIQGLLAESVYTFDALTVAPTWSGTGWSSMCTGVWPDKHGVTDNSFSGANFEAYPHFIARTEEYDASLHTASIVHWSPINTQINTHCDIEINVPTDLEVKNLAVAYLENNDPDVLFVAFDDVDHAGHSYGFSPTIPEYMATIALTDGYVGEIMETLLARPHFEEENWMVLLTTDHGGNLAGHGGATFEERNVFIIVWKPGQEPHDLAKDSTVFSLSSGLQFNGQNQYVLPADSAPFQFGADQDFSVEMRVRYTEQAGDAAFISNKNWDSGLNRGWVLSTPTGDLTRWKANISDGAARRDVNGGFIADGNWHHLAVTFDRDGMMSLYQDGNPVGQTSIADLGNVDSGLPVVIGQDGSLNYDYFFSGAIAEVRLWNTALTAATVAAYTCGPIDAEHPDLDNLAAYWKMDEGQGNTLGNAVSGSPTAQLAGDAANWTAQPGSLTCYDFSDTPRLIDVAATALTHLCIPIDPVWALDGQSLVPECAPTSVGEMADAANWVEVFPNPTGGEVNLRLAPAQAAEGVFVTVFAANGQPLAMTMLEGEAQESISLAPYPAGLYFLRLLAPDGRTAAVSVSRR